MFPASAVVVEERVAVGIVQIGVLLEDGEDHPGGERRERAKKVAVTYSNPRVATAFHSRLLALLVRGASSQTGAAGGRRTCRRRPGRTSSASLRVRPRQAGLAVSVCTVSSARDSQHQRRHPDQHRERNSAIAAPWPRLPPSIPLKYAQLASTCVESKATAGEDEDDDHVGEGEDDAVEHRHRHDRQQQGKADGEQLAEEPGAVDVRRVFHVLRDRANPASRITVASGNVRQTWTIRTESPARSGASQRLFVSGPVPGDSHTQQPNLPHQVVDRAVDVVERPQPAQHAERDGRRPGQQHQEADEPLAVKISGEHQGQDVGQQQHDRL